MGKDIVRIAKSQGVEILPPSDWQNMEASPAGMYAMGLAKSLLATEAGTGLDAATFTQGRSLQHESLEDVLISTTFEQDDARLWQRMPKRAIHATVDQFSKRSSLGDKWGMAVGEASNPSADIAAYARAFANVKFYRNLRSVSDVSMMVNNVGGNTETLEEQAGIINLIHRINRDMYWGDSDVFPERIDGLFPTLANTSNGASVIDAAGAKITSRDKFNQLFAEMRNKAGRATNLFMNPLLGEDISIAYATSERVALNQGDTQGVWIGMGLAGINSQFGRVALELDPFNEVGPACPSAVEGNTGRPSAAGGVSSSAGSTGGTIPTGSYWYKVCAVNENGQSVAVALSGAQAVTLGEKVTLTITNPVSGNDATGYYIYRSAIDASAATDCRFLCACAIDSGATTSFVDDGTWVPGTSHIVALDLRPSAYTIQWSQLLPATRRNLAETTPAKNFLVCLYGALRIAKPEWLGLIKNVLPTAVADAGWDPLGKYSA